MGRLFGQSPRLTYTTRWPSLDNERCCNQILETAAQFLVRSAITHVASTMKTDQHFSHQEYFSKTIGPVKRVFLTYGPNGQSKGVSTIVFKQATSAHEAATKLNGVKVDNRAMRVRQHCFPRHNSPLTPSRSKSSLVLIRRLSLLVWVLAFRKASCRSCH